MSQPSESRTFASDGKLMQPSSLHDLANYQRYWEDLHQRTLMQIQQIKGKPYRLVNLNNIWQFHLDSEGLEPQFVNCDHGRCGKEFHQ